MNQNFFRTRRDALNLTQRAIAQALNVTTTTISNWERGTCRPQVSQYREVARVYQVTAEELALQILQLVAPATALAG